MIIKWYKQAIFKYIFSHGCRYKNHELFNYKISDQNVNKVGLLRSEAEGLGLLLVSMGKAFHLPPSLLCIITVNLVYCNAW